MSDSDRDGTTQMSVSAESNNTERELSFLWMAFAYDVLEATQNLLYLLSGIELQHRSILSENTDVPPEHRANRRHSSGLTYVNASVTAFGFDMFEITQRCGRAEQLAYKGWLVDVYGRWEDHYRSKTQRTLRSVSAIDDTIRPQLPVLGDLRLIRNDCVHNGGIASHEYTGKCTLLRWFEPGEHIIFDITHVLEVLHKLRLTTDNMTGRVFSDSVKIAGYQSYKTDAARNRQPRIISVIADIDTIVGAKEFCLTLDLMYSNGIVGRHANRLGISEDNSSSADLMTLAREIQLTPDGDLVGPIELGLGFVAAQAAYETTLKWLDGSYSGEGAKVTGQAVSPPLKFR